MTSAPAQTSEQMATDLERVQRVLDGDTTAFEALVNDYQRSVYNLAYRMLGDAREAEDAAQESFIRAFRYLHSFTSGRSFKTWILSITSHYCIDLIRKRRMRLLSIDDLLPSQELPLTDDVGVEDSVLRDQRDEALHRLLAKLSADERAILVLRYWQEMSYDEIAETMNTNRSVVKSRLFRARQALANQMRVQVALEAAPAW